MANKCIVYGLVDPREPDVVRYVGATSKPLKVRLSGHCSHASNNLLRKWMARLSKAGIKPLIVPIEECEESDAARIEARWIGNFRLTNGADGQALNHNAPGFVPGGYYLHKRLIAWRGDLTQKQAASVLGVSVSTYRNWEYGVNIPGLLAMKEIDRALETKPT